MTEFLLHWTKRRNVAGIRKHGLKAGGPHGDRAFIFLVPEREDSFDHPLLRHGTDTVVKVDAHFFMSANGIGWWTKNATFQTRGIDDNAEIGIPPEFIVDIYYRSSGDPVLELPTPELSSSGHIRQGRPLLEITRDRREAEELSSRVAYTVNEIRDDLEGLEFDPQPPLVEDPPSEPEA